MEYVPTITAAKSNELINFERLNNVRPLFIVGLGGVFLSPHPLQYSGLFCVLLELLLLLLVLIQLVTFDQHPKGC